MKRYCSIVNGVKGGRPIFKPNNSFNIPDIKIVLLTENQYNALIEKYGNKVLSTALNILEEWLIKSPLGKKFQGKNNYGYFRSDGWLINEAKRICN